MQPQEIFYPSINQCPDPARAAGCLDAFRPVLWEARPKKKPSGNIDWQITRARAKNDIFSAFAPKAIFRHSQGIPRLVNRCAPDV